MAASSPGCGSASSRSPGNGCPANWTERPEMSQSFVHYRVDGHVASITLARPEKRNAMNRAMRDELWRSFDRAGSDECVRAVLVRAEGGHFCAGGDIADMRPGELDAEAGRDRILSATAGARRLLELPKPVVMAVDGCAYGAGCSLVLAADLVIATDRVRLAMSFLRIGLVPDLCSLFTLPRIVGWARAKALLYSNREIGAEEALQLGIASEVVSPDALDHRTGMIARALTRLPRSAFAMTKAALARSLSADLDSMCDTETSAQAIAYSTSYHADAAGRLLAREPLPYQWPLFSLPGDKDADNPDTR
ncbi:MAG: enoyl-CoA hydratase/isomerase family protein [Alcaligenaceae bacterium]|nr:enoyl-CoA hydratase/isomerase family protein [Alcaligenaceae bacterium SAGV5]MPS55101.1 enoyl-CoA hydratase/isomerase family protein [Alcaligenaceae bacterium SAGV3]MPT59212.1 enoyl-CoA hydratase/isomerase family protein [Alcaligenaceae bacterium]